MADLEITAADGSYLATESGIRLIAEQSVSIVNVIKTWKGAVQPAETSPTGNEIRLWKGAVEPAVEPAAPIAAGLSFVRNIARNLVRNTVRNTAS